MAEKAEAVAECKDDRRCAETEKYVKVLKKPKPILKKQNCPCACFEPQTKVDGKLEVITDPENDSTIIRKHGGGLTDEDCETIATITKAFLDKYIK